MTISFRDLTYGMGQSMYHPTARLFPGDSNDGQDFAQDGRSQFRHISTLLNTALLFHVENIFLCCFIIEIVCCMMLKIYVKGH
jgi:hypothetical protein